MSSSSNSFLSEDDLLDTVFYLIGACGTMIDCFYYFSSEEDLEKDKSCFFY